MPSHQQSYLAQAGFSLMEVMAAIAILTIATTSIMGLWGGMYEARKTVSQRQQAQTLLSSIAERLIGSDWASIGSSSAAPWSQGRFFDRDGAALIGRAPLTEHAADVQDDIVRQRLVSDPTGMPHLKIYIEYYRALDVGSDKGLLLPDGHADAGKTTAFRARFAQRSFRDGTRLTGTSPTSAVTEGDPICIRLLATWTDPGPMTPSDADVLDANGDGLPSVHHVELFIARRR